MKKIRKDLPWLQAKFIAILTSPLSSSIVAPIITAYYLTLDVWGDSIEFISNHKSVHEKIFFYLIISTCILATLRGVIMHVQKGASVQYEKILSAIIFFSEALVKKKKDRFLNKAKFLRAEADVFKAITQPDDQIEFALDSAKALIRECFGIEKKDASITIIQGDGNTKWWYKKQCDPQRVHTKASVLMTQSSTAKRCYESGDSVFISNYSQAHDAFFPSKRTKERGAGSIYCRPIRVNVGGRQYSYILTICTYGKTVGIPYDVKSLESAERVFDGIAERIELELYLDAIKQFKESPARSAA